VSKFPPSPEPATESRHVPPGPLELVVFGRDVVQAHPLPLQGNVTIGRSSDNDIQIDHPSVSRRHALLHLGAALVLEDLGGVNGTHIHPPILANEADDTRRSLPVKKLDLAVGDHLTFGSVMSVLRRRSSQARPYPGEASPASAPSSRDGVVLSDPAMRALYAEAKLAAASPLSVLLLGETGVGKEVLARTIHLDSGRAAGPFLALNCSSLPESLLEGELFGYEKSSFTGATQSRPGLFESAEGGTLFLDEAGDLPMSVQVKLLRVLEERQVLRIGARRPRPIDVRFLAATNRDLEAGVARGTFREDLFYRLNGFTLTIPPLRERPADIAPLAEVFAAKACRDFECSASATFSAPALAVLQRYAWPGNVRELRNVVERAVVLGRGSEIRLEHLPPRLVDEGVMSARRPATRVVFPGSGATQPIIRPTKGSPEERDLIIAALEACNGNQGKAAEMLGMSRRTFISRLEEHGIERPRKKM
jgi:DNA-binding NtrC family response regulator